MKSSSASFLALSCVGFIATSPAMAAEAVDDAAATADQYRESIIVNGQQVQSDTPKATAPVPSSGGGWPAGAGHLRRL